MSSADIVSLYERHADQYDRDRSRALTEKAWLDHFLALARPGGTILDIGCGMAEPIARYLLEAGFAVVGIDRFDGLLAWDSFFHLAMADQRAMFPRFAAHALPGAPLLFTSGPSRGEAIGSYCGEPLYHASLDPQEYEALLSANGFSVVAHVAEDAQCGNHTVWLTRKSAC